MNTLTRVIRLTLALCLALCLGLSLAAPASWAKTDDTQKKSSTGSKTKSKKDSGKSKKKSTGEGSKEKSAAKSGGAGFRGLAWGSPLSVLNEPDLREKDGDMAYYTVLGDNMEVLGVAMREVVYVFCKGKLAGALTRYDGEINHLQIQARLGETYGTPLQAPANPRGDRSWRYDDQGTSVVVEYAPNPGTGAVAFMAKDRLAVCQGPPVDAAPAASQDKSATLNENGEEPKPSSKSKDKTKSKTKSSEKTSGTSTGKNGKPAGTTQE